ncbi:antiviral reverse transcriptase Drt3a [Aurantiacibacter rhizosphaerae]|uniref:Reverse transcriptase domain-containing protein n=1 Tax=Aurantiacibacter rhizosphaerae TaxID=2691582 RepID=A0A844XEI5_9SPHN|nr:antiviral reverse transcriptase Drt3a [Aurantiacibacter rhizosphaerae]MWV28082.1 hypothetical protein [Aurantiacibacter rhizosphaerae]
MFDSTLHAKTLARQIRATDFHSHLWSFSTADREPIVDAAVQLVNSGFAQVALRREFLGGKSIYQQTSLAETLIIRQISEGIRRVTNVKQSDRQSIVKSIIALSREGIPFHILKFDVKSFYETINTNAIISTLREDAVFSRQSVNVLSSFFDALQNQGIDGLPRGLGVSATLSEFAMRNYDRQMSSLSGVRFYNRFVDDIIVVALDGADLETISLKARSWLPDGLDLNRSKSVEFNFKAHERGATHATEHQLSFLGYRLDIGVAVRAENAIERKVVVDIADRKVARLKRRIAKAIIQFNADGNFADLHGRVKLLTSNYGFADPSSGQQRYSGLRYNYSLINSILATSLDELDRFLVNAITSRHPQNRLRPTLTTAQRRSLLGFGFRSGFVSNRFFSFTYSEVRHLTKCWSHA